MRLQWLAIGLGGALGTMARHGVNVIVARRYGHATPYATLVVNLAGCGLIGLIAGLLAGERMAMAPVVRSFLVVGVLGGFTTFSSFGLDTFTLARTGRVSLACWNVAVQVLVGLGAVAAGYALGLALGGGHTDPLP
jgi:fluoride exporter